MSDMLLFFVLNEEVKSSKVSFDFVHRKTSLQSYTSHLLSRLCDCYYTLCCKKVYHPTLNDNFNSSCPIPVIFGTIITE